MTVVQLAAKTDVEAICGRDLTTSEATRAKEILDNVSDQFRRLAEQTFTTSTSTVRLKVNGGRVYVPQRPVVSITTVTDDDGAAVAYTRLDQWLTVDLTSEVFVIVAYSHGGTVPDVVRLRIADIARRILQIPAAVAAGATQHIETRGPFTISDTYAVWAVGGQTMLAPDDVAFARSYKVRVPGVTVMVP